MHIHTPPQTVTRSAARLVIHAQVTQCSGSNLASLLQWLRTLFAGDCKVKCMPLRLQIADLQGNVMLASDNADTLLDVTLPAGTYQVTAQFGKVQRDYTLALEQGASFDLYLRLTSDKP